MLINYKILKLKEITPSLWKLISILPNKYAKSELTKIYRQYT